MSCFNFNSVIKGTLEDLKKYSTERITNDLPTKGDEQEIIVAILEMTESQFDEIKRRLILEQTVEQNVEQKRGGKRGRTKKRRKRRKKRTRKIKGGMPLGPIEFFVMIGIILSVVACSVKTRTSVRPGLRDRTPAEHEEYRTRVNKKREAIRDRGRRIRSASKNKRSEDTTGKQWVKDPKDKTWSYEK